MDSQIICDKAMQILRATNDGDSLTDGNLWLVQEAVNGHLNNDGIKAFEGLYASLKEI